MFHSDVSNPRSAAILRYDARQRREIKTETGELPDRECLIICPERLITQDQSRIQPVFNTVACYRFLLWTSRCLVCDLTDAIPTPVSVQTTRPQLEGHNCVARTLEIASWEWLSGSRPPSYTVHRGQPDSKWNEAIFLEVISNAQNTTPDDDCGRCI